MVWGCFRNSLRGVVALTRKAGVVVGRKGGRSFTRKKQKSRFGWCSEKRRGRRAAVWCQVVSLATVATAPPSESSLPLDGRWNLHAAANSSMLSAAKTKSLQQFEMGEASNVALFHLVQ